MINARVKQLVIKDLDLMGRFIPVAVIAGLISMVIAAFNEFSFFIGTLLFITTLAAFGIMIAVYNIAQEREKKTHIFILSLPITAAEYTLAKIISSLICFIVPWAILFAMVIAAIIGLDSVMNGYLPYATLVMLYFLCSFCFFITIIIAYPSEKAMVCAILLTNIMITVVLQGLARIPAIAATMQTELITWTPVVIGIALIEVTLCVLCIATAVYIQNQKTDLV